MRRTRVVVGLAVRLYIRSLLNSTTATTKGHFGDSPAGLLPRRIEEAIIGGKEKGPRQSKLAIPAPASENPAPTSPPIRGQRGQRSAMAEAIARVQGASVVFRDDENGVVRMKIVVSKQQLRQMVLSMGGRGRSNNPCHAPSSSPPSSSPQALEQLLHVLRKRHMKRAASEAGKAHRSAWRPALQSIPEEM